VSCDKIRPQLTAYLDGELEGDRGSVVRGHLRGCEACRALANDEAALRDGLRTLPTVDPPSSLWAGVQARLAAAEVADAQTPGWRLALGRWMPQLWSSRLAVAGVLAAAAITVVWWRTHRVDTTDQVVETRPTSPDSKTGIGPTPPPPPVTSPTDKDDVTASLAGDEARKTRDYDDSVKELLALADEARPRWSEDRKATFAANVAKFQARVTAAAEGRPRQRVLGELSRYLQGVLNRDRFAMNDATFAGEVQ
jgi:hypothetical protein